MATKYVAITDRPIEEIQETDWEPWVKCDENNEQLAVMALRKLIRERGGMMPKEHITYHVYVRQTMELPCEVHYFTMNAHGN